MSRRFVIFLPCLAVLIALAARPARAQDAWQSDGLTATIDSSGTGAPLYSAPGAQPTGQLAPGTTVTLTGVSAEGSGLVPVSTPQGPGWIDQGSIAALPSSVFPSAVNVGSYVTSNVPGQGDQVITVDITGLIQAILALSSAQGTGLAGTSGNWQSGVALLGQGGEGNGAGGSPGLTGYGAPPLVAGAPGGQGAGSPAAPSSSAGGVMRGIIASAETAQRGASGRYLPTGSLYTSLPHRQPMLDRRQVTVQLADAQGQGLGGTATGPVEDVGPWRTDDDYWTQGRRPAAEAMQGQRVSWDSRRQGWWPVTGGRRGRYKCNGAGIDVSAGAWKHLLPGASLRQAGEQLRTVNWWFAGPAASTSD